MYFIDTMATLSLIMHNKIVIVNFGYIFFYRTTVFFQNGFILLISDSNKNVIP